ncbi:hypothetical protein M949_1924 [Riemerella anatipestifer CH3]|nr:hypothetical protein M949_1924 [Riemerella anatipestifer CH3]
MWTIFSRRYYEIFHWSKISKNEFIKQIFTCLFKNRKRTLTEYYSVLGSSSLVFTMSLKNYSP